MRGGGEEMKTEQEIIAGSHPIVPHIYGVWLQSTDLPASVGKKHRMLVENYDQRNGAIEKLAQWIVDYHIHKHSKRNIDEQKKILDKHQLGDYIDKLKLLPTADRTKKGNLGEIILIEYLKSSRGFLPYVHRLQYNTNTNQSMKGDDVLMFNPTALFSEVLYGECKFRKTPTKKVVEDIVSNLEGAKRLPISMGFVANVLEDRGEQALADAITELQLKVENGLVPVSNVGFLISTKSDRVPSKDTKQQVEKYLKTSNTRLVMISLGVENPIQIVDEAFAKADDILKTL